MKYIQIDQKLAIAAYLRRFSEKTIYQLGDLDDFFWPATRWYVALDTATIQEIVLQYNAPDQAVILAMTLENSAIMRELIQAIRPDLPHEFYAHLSHDVAQELQSNYYLVDHGEHYKMVLRDPTKLLDSARLSDVVPLTERDLPAIYELYAHYAGNWFDQRMLETGCYFGVWHGAELISIAGIHVYSAEYRVAALGNITTQPQFRGRGLAKRTISQLCQHLLKTVDTIGLNVKCANQPAIGCYQALGFEIVSTYNEYSATHKIFNREEREGQI